MKNYLQQIKIIINFFKIEEITLVTIFHHIPESFLQMVFWIFKLIKKHKTFYFCNLFVFNFLKLYMLKTIFLSLWLILKYSVKLFGFLCLHRHSLIKLGCCNLLTILLLLIYKNMFFKICIFCKYNSFWLCLQKNNFHCCDLNSLLLYFMLD